MPLRGWQGVLALVALLKVVAALAGFFLAGEPGDTTNPIPRLVYVVVGMTFACAALVLILGGSTDRRAVTLGALFLLVASAFSDRLIHHAALHFHEVRVLLLGLRATLVDAFLPFFAWSFFNDFPSVREFGPAVSLRARLGTLALVVSIALFGVNLASFGLADGLTDTPLRLFMRHEGGPLYWPPILLLSSFGLVLSVWRSRRATPEERRRVKLLLAGLAVGTGPVVLLTLLLAVPFVAGPILRPSGLRATGLLIYPALMSIPLTTAYAVRTRAALDVRLVVRQAVRHALARGVVVWATLVPFVAFATVAFANRDRTLSELFTGRSLSLVVITVVLGLSVLRFRRPVLEVIDRNFFREQYDARRILESLVKACREADEPEELDLVLESQITRALHCDRVGMLLADAGALELSSDRGGLRPLGLGSGLARTIATSYPDLIVEWDPPPPFVHRLPEADKQWLADSGVRLFMPLYDSERELLGVLCLGQKRSELPFTDEDRALLRAIADSAALALENRDLKRSRQRSVVAPRPSSATEFMGHTAGLAEGVGGLCEGCGVLRPRDEGACPSCEKELSRQSYPILLSGKYRLRERIGRGGMGVVFRALDLQLNRNVGVKTLPRVDPSKTDVLRREARAMASVSHPNLATIYAMESWHGVPFLIVEFLSGGTLSDRLRGGPQEVSSVLAMIAVLTEAVATLHAVGILHRDIKPSNIGFTATGTPKLLDFGIATLTSLSSVSVEREAAGFSEVANRPPFDATGEPTGFVGSLPYLPPEVLRGEPPGPALDLWSLNMVAYEALCGTNPVLGGTPYAVFQRLTEEEIPDIRQFAGHLTPTLAGHFGAALASNPNARPPSARALAGRFRTLLTLTDDA